MGGLNQNAVRGIAAYSSFVHTAWIIGAIMESFFFFLFIPKSICITTWSIKSEVCNKKSK